MRFLVCIKQVVDASKMEVDPVSGRLKRNNANSIMILWIYMRWRQHLL